MKALFDQVSRKCSEITTKAYSTSFSFGIKFLDKKLRGPIYNIYGFVRFADEIVDSFHGFDKPMLLEKFKRDTFEAIDMGISLNPILNSFQETVNEYGIDHELIRTFLRSMEMDLDNTEHSRTSYEAYILGSAEVVGLMCLRVFIEGDESEYQRLKPSAMRLGAAFQKVNFLRDIQADFEGLGRTYFPGVDMASFNLADKLKIESEIDEDFAVALEGIKSLPKSSKKGVYLAYIYYIKLFHKIKSVPPELVMKERIRIDNGSKIGLMFNTMVKNQLRML